MLGAEVTDDGIAFRIWAPDRTRASVVIDGKDVPLESERNGYFRAVVRSAKAGTRYRYRLDGGDESYPDPASRCQPDGPHGDSVVIDPSKYAWRDREWRGPDTKGLVIYEMHMGTFTREGTWRAAAAMLPVLRDAGITMIEMMPIHEFPGRFGWGYDGVDLWAPSHLYGTPDDLRAFVDEAHANGLSVILDVVYNHLGPDGNYLERFTEKYFTDRYQTDWGKALNFDGDGCEGVREFFAQNAAYWIRDFHFDGLRLDATQSLFDSSPEHIIGVIARHAREASRGRRTFIVAENEPQDTVLIDRYGVDALWNDDWHHSAMVEATGKREAYYTDYAGTPQEFVSMARHGFLYQGQWYSWQKNRRGTPSGHLHPRQLVCYLQNHDQVANSATGERLDKITSPGRYRALTALLLLGPNTPMLFQGQEFASSAPFLYFADHKPELAQAVETGRRDFLKQFPSIHDTLPPHDPHTFEVCKLDHAEREKHKDAVALHRELLTLRREYDRVDGAVIGPEALVLRFPDDRLLVVNLGPELVLNIVDEPLLAAPPGTAWKILWSSEPGSSAGDSWRIPAESATLFSPAASDGPGR